MKYFQTFCIYSSKDALHADWYVTTGNRDIGDFYVSLRDAKNAAYLEYYLPYDTRSIDIAGNTITNEYTDQLQICVFAKTSGGMVRSLFDTQCVQLPKNFNDIKRRYNVDYNYAYTVFSNNMKKDSKRIFNKFSSGGMKVIALPFIIIILLNVIFIYI